MMNPKLRSLFILIGLLTLIVISIIFIPRGLSLYYQTKGGQSIDWVLRSSENISDFRLGCDPLPVKKTAAIAKVDKAINELDLALRLNSNNSQAYYYLGQSYCLLGDPEKARSYFENYINQKPNNPLGYIGLGFAFEKMGDQKFTTSAWKSAGLTPYEFNSAGDEEFQAERYERAIRWYKRSIIVEPRSAESWIKLGTSYEQINDRDSALDAYSRAWEIDPELSTANLVDAFKSKGDLNSVEDTLHLMLDQYPDSANRLIWFQELGSSYQSHGDYYQAIDLYTQAIREYPDQPELHISLGWAFYEHEDGVDIAQSEFEKAIDIDEKSASAFYAMGQLMHREEEFDEAEKWLKQALELVPQNRWYMLYRADNHRSAGDLNKAIGLYQDIIALYPDFSNAYFQISLAYQQNNQFQEAVNAIETALTLVDPSVSNFVRAGDIYRLAGNEAKAIAFYNRALKLDIDNQRAIKGLQLLSEP